MTRQVILLPAAEADVDEAIEWLQQHAGDLPERWRVELRSVFNSILEYPEMYPIVHRGYRRAALRRFPYSVFYSVERDEIVVIAIVHQARDASVWMRRI